MRAVRLPAREALEFSIRVAAILVDAARCRRMQGDPFVEPDLAQGGAWRLRNPQELETVVEIRQELAETRCLLSTIGYLPGFWSQMPRTRVLVAPREDLNENARPRTGSRRRACRSGDRGGHALSSDRAE